MCGGIYDEKKQVAREVAVKWILEGNIYNIEEQLKQVLSDVHKTKKD